MNWKEKHSVALKELMDGDENAAILHWKDAVACVEKCESSVELGQMYHFFGKMLSDRGEDEQALTYLKLSEATIFECEPGHDSYRQIKYDLGRVLSKLGRTEEASHNYSIAIGNEPRRPVPEGLEGKKKDTLTLKSAVKAFQKVGLMKDLSPTEFKRIHKALVEAGRADDDDIESIHPFDLLYDYYDSRARSKADNVVMIDDIEGLDLAHLVSDLNTTLGMKLFSPNNIVNGPAEEEDSSEQLYFIVNSDEIGIGAAKIQKYSEYESLVEIYNYALRAGDESRRFLRFAGYSDREGLILMDIKTVRTLFLAGAADEFFENLFDDVEPLAPELFSLE